MYTVGLNEHSALCVCFVCGGVCPLWKTKDSRVLGALLRFL